MVLPVGVDLRRIDPVASSGGPPATILWNHRWDPDKGIAEFLEVLAGLADEGSPFRVVLAGEPFVGQPQEHAGSIEALGDRVVHVGYLDANGYVEALRGADVVVSAAHQEFFGVAVVEALYAGAFPVLPHRVVYPERIPADLHDRCLYRDGRGMADRIRWAVENRDAAHRIGSRLREQVAVFDWSAVAPQYDDWLDDLALEQAPR
jgi:glycosyltransferase involved in cell wall biosynthesis